MSYEQNKVPPPAVYAMPQYGQPYVVGQQQQPGPLPMTVVHAPPKPENHMLFALFVTLCCNCICGLIGVYFAMQTDSSYNSGQYDVAEVNSRKARRWSKIGLIFGIIMIIVVVIFVVLWYAVFAGMLVSALSSYDTEENPYR